jgi:hypothetical protein
MKSLVTDYLIKENKTCTKPGQEEGEVCGRNGCTAIIEISLCEDCSCHIRAPCSSCISMHLFCPECDWNFDNDENFDI